MLMAPMTLRHSRARSSRMLAPLAMSGRGRTKAKPALVVLSPRRVSIAARECTTTVGHIVPPIVGQDVPLGDETSRDASLPPTPMIRRHAAPASPPFRSGLLYPS